MPLNLITDPTVEPVTLAEAKLHCRIDADLTSEDALVSALITAARERCEHEIGRAILTQTWERVLDAFPTDDDILLGMPTVQSVESVKYIDAAGVERTVSGASYLLDNADQGWAILANGAAWPATADTANAVRVIFISGWTAPAAVPESIKLWIKLHVGEWYASREAASDKQRAPLTYADGLLDRHRNYWRVG